ncbi:calcium/sodium antiporter, partial [Candidatus Saccharibacteria bacterium]|nr:calcium/sodium antiporter [Candidatus Saccharibacteria bacterium]
IFLQIILLIVGFIFLIKGADWLVSGASSVASNFKVSKLLIGLTIVAFGTGAPELAVSFSSLIGGNTDILLGNVIGSNIINILLLIGVAAIIRPIKVQKDTVSKELPLLLLISTALIVLVLDAPLAESVTNVFSRSDAIICLLLFCIFLYYLISLARKNRQEAKTVEKPAYKLGKSFLLVIVGLAGVVAGSQLVVSSASTIATAIGISERIISLTVIALGTSLPELVTTITAARKGESDLLVGNIIGSNIFNICVVLALPVAVSGSISPENFETLDLVMFIGSAIILGLLARRNHDVTRTEGILMLAIFTIYYGYIVYGAFA